MVEFGVGEQCRNVRIATVKSALVMQKYWETITMKFIHVNHVKIEQLQNIFKNLTFGVTYHLFYNNRLTEKSL